MSGAEIEVMTKKRNAEKIGGKRGIGTEGEGRGDKIALRKLLFLL